MTKLLLLMIAFGMTACVSKPVPVDVLKTQGLWETKVQVKDLNKQVSSTVSIDWIAIRHERMRAEVTGPFGVSIATLALKKDQMQLLLHSQKKYYYGKITTRSLEAVLGVSVDPRMLYYALFDEELPEKSFQCVKDAEMLVQECKAKNSDLIVRWAERYGDQKRVSILRSQFEIHILVKKFTTKVQDDDKVFTLQAPESYKVYQLD